MTSKALFTSNNEEWETPHAFFASFNKRYHFTLDACASQHNAKVDRHFSITNDGLTKSWNNEIVWMNPPYGTKRKNSYGQIDWVHKAYNEVQHNGCRAVVCLLPARTDTKLFHTYVMKSSMILFIRGRLKFVGAQASAVFPSMVVTFESWDRMRMQRSPIISTITSKGNNIYDA